MCSRRYSVAAVLAAACFCAFSIRMAGAQGLADRVPADAVAYAEWAGSDVLGGAYDASHFKAFLTTLNLPDYLTAVLKEDAARKSPEQAEEFAMGAEVLKSLAEAPTAAYLGDIDFADPQHPVPHMALFSKVGKEKAAALVEKIGPKMEASVKPDDPPHGVAAVGDYFLFYVGDAAFKSRLEGAPAADNLGASESFKHALAQLGPAGASPAALAYVDGPNAVKLLEAVALARPNRQIQQYLPIIIDGFGLSNLGQIAWAGKFEGANWQGATFVGMKARRNGVLAFLDNPPLTADALKLIPASATSAAVFRFDAIRFLADVDDVAAQVSPNAPQQLERIFQQFYAFTGVELKKDLLPSLGTEFVVYSSADATGNSLRGITLVNKLRDPKKAVSSFAAAETFINLLIAQRDPTTKIQFQTQPLPAPLDKVEAHVITLEKFTPAWAIVDDTFFLSLSVPGLESAIEAARAGGAGGGQARASILENPQFAALRATLGHPEMSSFHYIDLVKGAPESYEMVSQAIAKVLAGHPENTHPYMLPPLNKITPDLGPVLRISWTDGEGFHSRQAEPFPFAYGLSPAQFFMMYIAESIQARHAAPQPAPAPGLP